MESGISGAFYTIAFYLHKAGYVPGLMQIVIGGGVYYLVCFMDEYSRYIVHHQVLLGMDGKTVSLAGQAAIDRLPKGADGKPLDKPVIQ